MPVGFTIKCGRWKLNLIGLKWVCLLVFDERSNEIGRRKGPCRTAPSIAYFDFIKDSMHLVVDQSRDVNPKPEVKSMQGTEEVPSPLFLVAKRNDILFQYHIKEEKAAW
ncbi:hypothetical protein CsSME_00049918 [Camellia sinensis var. sinensis]